MEFFSHGIVKDPERIVQYLRTTGFDCERVVLTSLSDFVRQAWDDSSMVEPFRRLIAAGLVETISRLVVSNRAKVLEDDELNEKACLYLMTLSQAMSGLDIYPHILPNDVYQKINMKYIATIIVEDLCFRRPGSIAHRELAISLMASYMVLVHQGGFPLTPEIIKLISTLWGLPRGHDPIEDGERLVVAGDALSDALRRFLTANPFSFGSPDWLYDLTGLTIEDLFTQHLIGLITGTDLPSVARMVSLECFTMLSVLAGNDPASDFQVRTLNAGLVSTSVHLAINTRSNAATDIEVEEDHRMIHRIRRSTLAFWSTMLAPPVSGHSVAPSLHAWYAEVTKSIDAGMVGWTITFILTLPPGDSFTWEQCQIFDIVGIFVGAARWLRSRRHRILREATAALQTPNLLIRDGHPDAALITSYLSGLIPQIEGLHEEGEAIDARCYAPECPNPHTPDEMEIYTCSRCKSAIYCSAACQKVDWKAHKPLCRVLVKP